MITAPLDRCGETLPARRWRAIGTSCEVVVSAPDASDAEADHIADRAQQRAAVLVVELDLACSRFRPDSELSRLRHGTAVTISPMLAGALGAALRTARATRGLVDPTVLAAVTATGYDADLDVVRERGTLSDKVAAEPAPGHWRITHDPARRMALIPHRVEIDLGASAKAWLADTIAARLVGEGIVRDRAGVLVNLGGDLAAAGVAPGAGWRIRVDDDRAPGSEPVVISVRGGGVATSSTRRRTWRTGGRIRHHIVDPRTGETAPSTWQTVTVAARSCELANAAATAAIVLGEAAPAWLAGTGVHARLLHADASVVLVGDWPED